MTRTTTLEVLALAALVAIGCGGDDSSSTMTTMDGSVPPGMDGGPAFDPDLTYDGEGDPCSMSIECGQNQLCVDDQCVRHERFEASELNLGELRRSTPDMVAATPIDREATWPWSDLNGFNYLIGPDYWNSQQVTVAGEAAVTLTHFSPVHCQALLFGPSQRVVAVESMLCTAIDVGKDGSIALVGLDTESLAGRVVVFRPGDEEPSTDMLIGETWAGELSAEAATDVRLALPSSVIFENEEKLIISFGVDEVSTFDAQLAEYREYPDMASIAGDGWNPPWLAFASVEGEEATLLRTGSPRASLVEGELGWLGRVEGEVVALVSRFSEGIVRRELLERTLYSWPVTGIHEPATLHTGVGLPLEMVRHFSGDYVPFLPNEGSCGPLLVPMDVSREVVDLTDGRASLACDHPSYRESLGLYVNAPVTLMNREGVPLLAEVIRSLDMAEDGTLLLASPDAVVAMYSPELEGRLSPSFPAVSRFGKSVEMLEQTRQGLGVVEASLSTGAGE